MLDCVFLCVLRCLVVSHHHYLPELKAIEKAISTDLLVNSFRKQFAVQIDYTPFGELVFEESVVMKEEKDYTYLRRLTESMIESTNEKKTSECSSSKDLLGNFLDMSKSLADISVIEQPPKHHDEAPPTSSEDFEHPKLINCLSNVRRCDSMFAGHDSSSGEGHTNDRRKTSRESKEGTPRIREAHSDRDDDSDGSGASCVIYKVEFGSQPHYKLPSPRTTPKLSPRRNVRAEKELSNKAVHSNRHVKFSESSNSSNPPSISVIQTPNIPGKPIGGTQQQLPSKLYTIPSVDDSCIEESMIAAVVEHIDSESMKHKLC